jgi:hypothetical protein
VADGAVLFGSCGDAGLLPVPRVSSLVQAGCSLFVPSFPHPHLWCPYM